MTSLQNRIERVFLATDERMLLHAPISAEKINDDNSDDDSDDDNDMKRDIMEVPRRVTKILERLNKVYGPPINQEQVEEGNDGQVKGDAIQSNNVEQKRSFSEKNQTALSSPFVFLPCKMASKETIALAHSVEYYEKLKKTVDLTDEELQNMTKELGDGGNELYFSRGTFVASLLACGGVLECVNAVMSAKMGITRALAVVRPPGHHACENKCMGFCFFNSVAVSAKYAVKSGKASRVVILDWDIHHGNGTQDIVYDDPNIMYISLHRTGTSKNPFYPGTGLPNEVGNKFTNVNIAWTKKGMGNVEYSAAMVELVLPMLSVFNPDLVLVSCGFDAVKGDLIGDCELTPNFYKYMTESLLRTLGRSIPIVIVLEGGYNISVNALCMESVAEGLLAWNKETKFDENSKKDNEELAILETSTSNDNPSNFKKSNKGLVRGQSTFVQYWPPTSLNNSCIKLSGIKAINKTIKEVKSSPMLDENNAVRSIDERMASRVVTRSRSSRNKLQPQNASEEVITCIENQMSKMQI